MPLSADFIQLQFETACWGDLKETLEYSIKYRKISIRSLLVPFQTLASRTLKT